MDTVTSPKMDIVTSLKMLDEETVAPLSDEDVIRMAQMEEANDKKLYGEILEHPDYHNKEKVSSLTRWVLEEICMKQKSSSLVANRAWARDLWSYLFEDGDVMDFNLGEGKEVIFAHIDQVIKDENKGKKEKKKN